MPASFTQTSHAHRRRAADLNVYGAAVAGPVDLPGYPQLTSQTERKIFGEDLLRLHGMDAQVMRANLAGGAS